MQLLVEKGPVVSGLHLYLLVILLANAFSRVGQLLVVRIWVFFKHNYVLKFLTLFFGRLLFLNGTGPVVPGCKSANFFLFGQFSEGFEP